MILPWSLTVSICLDIVVFDYLKQVILFIEVLCPADIDVSSKEQEKLHKYCPLALDFCLVYKMPAELVPVLLVLSLLIVLVICAESQVLLTDCFDTF